MRSIGFIACKTTNQQIRELQMPLFTDEQYKQLIANGTENNGEISYPPVAKLFMSWTDCCWLLTGLDPEYPNIAFGLCDLGFGFPEVGYVDLNELRETQDGLKTLECDNSFEGKFPLIAYTRAAWEMHRIVTDDEIVAKHVSPPQP